MKAEYLCAVWKGIKIIQLCPTKEPGLLMSSLYIDMNDLYADSGHGGVREMQGVQEQLALSKGPEWMGNLLP
jgi:hypothetical protein